MRDRYRDRPPLRHPTSDLRFPRFSTFYLPLSTSRAPARSAFTLIELIVVIGIITVLMVLIAPAITSLKTAGEITNAGYTVQGALGQARTYARANNTYAWLGFYEEDGAKDSTNPATPGMGRLIMSIVASRDGSRIYGSSSAPIDPTRLVQVGKLIKVDDVHLPQFAVGSGTGETFDTRPVPDWNSSNQYQDSMFGELNSGAQSSPHTDTQYPFQYPVGNPAPTAQYTFRKTLQFSPTGENRINSTYDIRRVLEIGLLQTRGNVAPTPTGGTGKYAGNVVALQVSGFGSNVKIYRR
jgi:prepilin-type N-terminal cleavage/methylation domain-containing protein